MIVLPAASMLLVPAGSAMSAPIASIRLPFSRIVPRSITSLPPRIVTRRALTNAIRPTGASWGRRKPSSMPAVATGGSAAGVPSTNVLSSRVSRPNSCDPSVHQSFRESPDQWIHSPASRVTWTIGSAFWSADSSTALPVRANGTTRAWKRSVQASHFSSGDTAKSRANSDAACARSSVPSTAIDFNVRFLSSITVKNSRSDVAPYCGALPLSISRRAAPPAIGTT